MRIAAQTSPDGLICLRWAFVLALGLAFNLGLANASAFEGRIQAAATRGGEAQGFLYTIGTNCLRVERTETDRPYTVNLVGRDTGDLTLLFLNNHSFVRLKPAAENPAATPPGMPALPPGVGPQASPSITPPGVNAPAPPATIGPTNLPGGFAPPQFRQLPPPPQIPPEVGPAAVPGAAALPSLPQAPPGVTPGIPGGMPAMPMMRLPMEHAELKATGEKTNLLGFACEKYELKQRGEVMEIWATDKLLPFQPYLQNQPPRFGPRMLEEQWGGLLQAKKLFPLLAVLRFEPAVGTGQPPPAPGPERLRFEVKSVTPAKITDASLFQPPPDYQELQPLPF